MLLAQEPKRLSDVLRYADTYYSEDDGTFEPGTYTFGMVLGQKANGNYVPWDPSGTDGAENVAGMSIAAMTIDKPKKAVLIARHAIVVKQQLDFIDGVTPAQKVEAIGDLKKLGIIARGGI